MSRIAPKSSGYNLREIIDHIDELRFRSQKEKDELSHLYEAKIRNMGNAGRNGGEYYTPCPLIRRAESQPPGVHWVLGKECLCGRVAIIVDLNRDPIVCCRHLLPTTRDEVTL
jgi:hypothetical protein